MKLFTCPNCAHLVFFDNTRCLRCGTPLAIEPLRREVVVDDPGKACTNRELAACNWLAAEAGQRCLSCLLTRTRPADDDQEARAGFQDAEAAKRRLVFQFVGLGLVLEPRDEERGTGVAFDLLSSAETPVTTGHAGGVITLDLAESDAVHREQVRQQLREPYRTVLGHFRHEIGHYAFIWLVRDSDLDEARRRFGDERTDYQAALDRHYREGAPSSWAEEHVSEYATMHPSEDFAETFAHYLHIRAVLETAAAYGLRVEGPTALVVSEPPLVADPAATLRDVGTAGPRDDLAAMIRTWLPLSYALNAVARSMGDEALYPFVLPPPVLDKLGFVHEVVARAVAPA